MSGDLAAALRAAAALVEAGDPDRFAACRLLDPGARDRLLPLYALNLEIARAPWAAREPFVAEMRLQWWVDALEALRDGGGAPAHEIGPALVPLRDQAGLMIALAEARRRDCWLEGFADGAALDAYLAETAGHLA
ncbi:MAG: squalene/phytoene synthase family protein, partial [Sphingomonadales bacterium]|nr:squalene/phytoene synthase family protein [Sphingomonadales bacterium]